ncbi:MAG: T9SS type A sorting domain-containing protein, partial [Bacteroidota bacterium]
SAHPNRPRAESHPRPHSGVYTRMVFYRCVSGTGPGAVVSVQPVAGPGRLKLASSSIALGGIVTCLTVDTTLTGLLINDGGSPITITSISADPVTKIEVVGLKAPFTMAVNERRNLQLRVSPKSPGPFEAKVTFFASSGQETFTVSGDGAPSLRFSKDTLFFPKGQAGTTICNESFEIPCGSTVITGVRISGDGALTWGFSPFPATPIDLRSGEKLSLCVQSTQAEGLGALVSISTDLGLVTFYVDRTEVTSVEEGDPAPVPGSVRVYPNPAASDVTVAGAPDERLKLSIYTLTGQLVQTIEGRGELRWDRRDISGAVVQGGLYMLAIDGSTSGRTLRKLVVY